MRSAHRVDAWGFFFLSLVCGEEFYRNLEGPLRRNGEIAVLIMIKDPREFALIHDLLM